MEAPFGLPLQWVEIVKNVKDGQELYDVTRKNPDRFSLLSAALDDPDWIRTRGADYVQKMLQEWNRLEVAPPGLAQSIRGNSAHIKPLLPETLEFLVEGQSEKVFPLLFQDKGGEWFAELYNYFAITEGKPIPLSGVPRPLFLYLKEFFYEGRVESLWKAEPEQVAAFYKLAEKNGLKELSEYIFRTFKNYLEEEALAQMLTKALKDRAWLFAKELCELINAKMPGLQMTLEGSGLKVILEESFPKKLSISKITSKHLRPKRV